MCLSYVRGSDVRRLIAIIRGGAPVLAKLVTRESS